MSVHVSILFSCDQPTAYNICDNLRTFGTLICFGLSRNAIGYNTHNDMQSHELQSKCFLYLPKKGLQMTLKGAGI